MHQAFKQLQNQYPDIDTLSMGMTGDRLNGTPVAQHWYVLERPFFGARDYANK